MKHYFVKVKIIFQCLPPLMHRCLLKEIQFVLEHPEGLGVHMARKKVIFNSSINVSLQLRKYG